MKAIKILGTRGIPAAHGGFETFAEYLALYLTKKGWQVTVYCQGAGSDSVYEDNWNGIKRVTISVKSFGVLSSVIFDWKSTLHAAKSKELVLTLGYNTAIFCLIYRIKRITNLINMDGIEWKRQKWGNIAKLWFYLNERVGCWLGNHLIADHPQIKNHLASRVLESKITIIPYGADYVTEAQANVIHDFDLEPQKYLTLIARAEPENSILEIVKGFSSQPRGVRLAVIGNYDFENNTYHKAVKEVASQEVVFLGAIYDKTVLKTLRFYCLAYIHGHQVGGTNPSLVEAMGAGNAIVCHDNLFNRWVVGSSGIYFSDQESFDSILNELLLDSNKITHMKNSNRERFKQNFTWEKILGDYESLLLNWI